MQSLLYSEILQSEIPQLALSFRDYIRAKYGVELELEQTSSGYRLKLAQDCPYFQDILQERDRFLKNPFEPRYQQASWQAGDSLNAPKRAVNFLPNFSHFAKAYLPPVTWLISLLCVVTYLLGFIFGNAPIFSFMHYPADISQQGQLWRYVSHTLVHLSLAHLLLNLTFWIYLGSLIERLQSGITLALLYFILAIMTGIAQNFASGPGFFGLSGVVYGLIGYAFVLERAAKYGLNIADFNLPTGFGLMIVVGVLSGFVLPWVGINVGNSAHITGLIIGGIIAGVSVGYRRLKRLGSRTTD